VIKGEKKKILKKSTNKHERPVEKVAGNSSRYYLNLFDFSNHD
jgi:hypothetical protein